MENSNVLTQKDLDNTKKIRNQYIRREDNLVDELKKLDAKAKTPGRVVATVMGVSGALVLGAGMSQVMVWNNMNLGLMMGIPGLAVTLLATPVYFLITRIRRKKFADQIFKISDVIMAANHRSAEEKVA